MAYELPSQSRKLNKRRSPNKGGRRGGVGILLKKTQTGATLGNREITNKHYRLKKSGVFLCNKRKAAIKPILKILKPLIIKIDFKS